MVMKRSDGMKGVNLKKLQELRIKANLTQEEVSKVLGYKTGLGYHYIETGRCKLKAEQAVALAKLYNVNIEELFFDDDSTKMVG